MTTKDEAVFRERQKIARRNLKRYWISQGSRRLAGYRTAAAERAVPDLERTGWKLLLLAILLASFGIWSLIF